MAMWDDTAHHYSIVTVTASGELQMRVYRVAGDDTPRELLDSFCIF